MPEGAKRHWALSNSIGEIRDAIKRNRHYANVLEAEIRMPQKLYDSLATAAQQLHSTDDSDGVVIFSEWCGIYLDLVDKGRIDLANEFAKAQCGEHHDIDSLCVEQTDNVGADCKRTLSAPLE